MAEVTAKASEVRTEDMRKRKLEDDKITRVNLMSGRSERELKETTE